VGAPAKPRSLTSFGMTTVWFGMTTVWFGMANDVVRDDNGVVRDDNDVVRDGNRQRGWTFRPRVVRRKILSRGLVGWLR
jgi:hypothetical protein